MLEGGDDIRNDNNDGNATAAGRPVVSLLEKYSSLSRGIDQARSEYAQRQLEIESIEGEIEKITDNDRPVADEGIETAILEKQTILLTLEDLMTKDLIEAEGSETLAKSNLDFIKSKEANAVRAFEDDQRKFLVSCKTFRDKVTNLSLRGECFGLTTPVAPLGAYAILRLRTLSKNRYKVDDNNDDDDGGHDDDDGNENENDNDENFQLIDDSLLLAMNLIEDNSDNNSKKNSINSDKEEEDDDDDEEIQDMLRQLREQEVRNEKYQKLLQDEKNKQSALQDAKDKRESQKKDLQSQCERLQRDIRDVQDQIENLKRQTKEAQTSAIQFRNDVERGLQNQASALAKATCTTSNTTIIPTTNATAATRRKISYNPYAPANRRPANTSSRTISPVMDPTAPTTNTSTNNNNSRSTSRQRGIVSGDGDGDDGDGDGRSRSPRRNRQQAASVMAMAIPMTQTAVPRARAPHQQFPHRSGKIRSSRHFGGAGTSFRAPGASLLRNTTTSNHGIVRQTKSNRHNNNTNNNSIWEDDSSDDSSQQMNGQKRRRNSSMLQELEDSDDSDDDNDDDNVRLNAPPTFSSSTKRKQN